MLVYTDTDGRLTGTLDSGYPADPERLAQVKQEQGTPVIDLPPLDGAYWYFPQGVPTIRPRLDYTVSEKQEGDDKVTSISGIPAGVLVSVRGPEGERSVETDGDDLDLVLRTPGEYFVTFDPFPHQPVTILIDVTAKGA